MYERLGDALEGLCQTGRNEVILVAPFIKRATLSRLLAAIPLSVRVRCVTRWRPDEVAAGVSDPDIWLDLKLRENTTLYLCPNLHAKYYRVDSQCLIGSANLTHTALAWGATPNFEILSLIDDYNSECQSFETKLFELSVPCHEAIYLQVKTISSLLKEEMKSFIYLNEIVHNQIIAESSVDYELSTSSCISLVDIVSWLPQTRQPADLFRAYSEQWTQISSTSRVCASNDLRVLQVPPGLSKETFEQYVAMQLLQMPCIAAVDDFVCTSQRFGAVRDFLMSLPCSKMPEFNPSYYWQTLMRWLLHFLPNRYDTATPRHSEIFWRKDMNIT